MTKAIEVQTPEIEEGLMTLVKEAKIELTKAESHAVAFNQFLKQLSEYSRPLADLDKENPTAEHAATARENRLKIVKVRTGAEDIKDERKAILLLEGNFIQANYNFVKSACELTESQYMEIEKFQERIQKEKAAKLKETRLALLAPFEIDTEFLPLDIMEDDRFSELLAKSKEAFEAVQHQRARVEADRVEAERLAEEKRVAEEKAEAERIRLQAIENERLKKEAERVRIEHEKIAAENAKRIAENDAKLKAEREAREKIEAELQAKKDQEEKEKEQAIAEQRERDAASKAALLAPDKEKINALYISIRDFAFPECQTEEAKAIIADIKDGFKIILEGIKTKSQTLK